MSVSILLSVLTFTAAYSHPHIPTVHLRQIFGKGDDSKKDLIFTRYDEDDSCVIMQSGPC